MKPSVLEQGDQDGHPTIKDNTPAASHAEPRTLRCVWAVPIRNLSGTRRST
jgi:hypothetical protein